MPTKEDLKYFQSMPLDIKVAMTKTRIREWVTHFGVSGTYISFSGGKDSTVLLHLVRELYPDVEAVFVNTGLEYPEIQAFAKSFDNVTVLNPKMTFNEVIKTYGYPFISKQVSHSVNIARRIPEGNVRKKVFAEDKTGKFAMNKWLYLVEKSDFIISDKCCDVIKKAPASIFQKVNDKKPILATMAEESALREKAWLLTSCNSFTQGREKSQPMSFWTEQDVLQYIKQNDIKLADVYGDVAPVDGQYRFCSCDDCKLCTTGERRTGCIFCGFGAHLEKESRFKRLKETHPKQYNYCIGGENMTLTAFGSLTKTA